MLVPGPYYKNQPAAKCGCYFPDVTRLFDDNIASERVLFCVTHGKYRVPCERLAMLKIKHEVPSPSHREEIRSFLRNGKRKIEFAFAPRERTL